MGGRRVAGASPFSHRGTIPDRTLWIIHTTGSGVNVTKLGECVPTWRCCCASPPAARPSISAATISASARLTGVATPCSAPSRATAPFGHATSDRLPSASARSPATASCCRVRRTPGRAARGPTRPAAAARMTGVNRAGVPARLTGRTSGAAMAAGASCQAQASSRAEMGWAITCAGVQSRMAHEALRRVEQQLRPLERPVVGVGRHVESGLAERSRGFIDSCNLHRRQSHPVARPGGPAPGPPGTEDSVSARPL